MKPIIRPDSLLGTYFATLQEAAAPCDFPQLMANVQHKLLIEAFRGFPSPWDRYCLVTSVNDFKSHKRAWLSEAEDLLLVGDGAPYRTTPFKDRAYDISVETRGRLFELKRHTVINDDLDAFKKVPQKLGRAAKRTVAKLVILQLESNGAAYDGNALFGTRAGLANQSFTNLTANAAGIAALQVGYSAIARATDPDVGEIMGLQAKYLLTSPNLAETARWLTRQTTIGRGATDAPISNPLLDSALGDGPLEPLIEPVMASFPNRWYMLAKPEMAHAIEIAFLDGKREPEVFLKASDAVRIAGGGRDDYGYEYDDISYKIRWDYGVKIAFYQPAFKGGN